MRFGFRAAKDRARWDVDSALDFCSSANRHEEWAGRERTRAGIKNTMKRKGLAELCCEEPFRIFFPAGFLIGGIGVLLWPLFYFGFIETYPSSSHGRLMIEGFAACFIFGFLGTAGPRVMSVQPFTGREVLRILALILGATTAHLCNRPAVGDGLFLIALILFAVALAKRFRAREDSPPPNFAMVGIAILNGLAGAAMIFFAETTNSAPNIYRLGMSRLNIAFPLLPILGVAPFFLRRLLDFPDDPSASARQMWMSRAAFALLVAIAIDASLVLEVFSAVRHVAWIGCTSAVIYVLWTFPLRGSGILATGLRLSVAAIIAGLGLMAVLPAYPITARHVVFIGGVTVAIFSVATRVILGHSGALHLIRQRSGWLGAALMFILLAMISRFSADFSEARNPHLVGAALCWLTGATIWGATVLPYVGRIEEE